MKILLCICSVLTLLSCSTPKGIAQGQKEEPGYLIKKIKSKNSWHIIYAQKQDSLYKIVVGKEGLSRDNCKKIVVGKYYDLELKSRRENVPVINGVKLKPVNYLDVKSPAYDKEGVECYSYDEKTEICIEPKKGIYDLYYTDDLKGLCYLK
ncbi:MAG: hypothetical protein CL554_19880 [Algoriphagus sp.]|jgi:hypothetical protein|uniref:hypothetical protein n=1 Tax=unclassified Algoriphagus TaxID=2641541 RepID=UPI000C38CAAA|nr:MULTISPECIES: hypothetical protein [unclassified Algoriphagus]MAL12735.1 hypothetical protein [Algoriphagus sp.]MAL14956.1 hypothetical protein [Algoriphagus sp.]MAL15670.1 hypothetical protein [Algoriphagus sp.]MAN89135.1 hypothetical protein [Algoriphagus sp.]QYH39517.1 hypothetical protein GYM62_12245 [Algoriphagus sp. NBT04N3]|tara:strand:- start:2583 stop:3035 length:453 start_codon:yes stop_codon:yes gene_type:complete